MAEPYDLPNRFVRWIPPLVTELLVAIVMIASSTGVRMAIERSFHGVALFVLIYPAIAGATLLAGLRSGTITLVGCQLLTWYYLVPVKRSFRFEYAGDVLSLILATNSALIVLWLVASYRRVARARTELETQRAEQARENSNRLEVLVAELHHRTRNVIAVVRSLAENTLERSGSMEDFAANYRSRLTALARAQAMLSHLSGDERITVDQLLHAELAAYTLSEGEGDRIMLDGPTGVRLRSITIQTLALALHELATNAVKYGALTQPQGRLTVRWRIEPPSSGSVPLLHLDWRESGVIMPDAGAEPVAKGYGRELIERVLPYQLSAETRYELGPDGVRCMIRLPVGKSAMANGAKEPERKRAAEAAL